MLQHVFSLARGGVIIIYPSSPSVALVTSPPANSFKDCRLGFLGTNRPSTRLYLAAAISDSGRCKLHSSGIRTCVTPERLRDSVTSFSPAGPQVWNGLPSVLRTPDLTFDRFKRGLKTYYVYIGVMRSQRLMAIDSWRYINILYVCMYVGSIANIII